MSKSLFVCKNKYEKKAISIIAGEETFINLSPFESIDQLNETVRHYKKVFGDILKKTDIAVLDILHRHSAKYTGVSFLRKTNIGKKINKSRRTIIRCCQRLEQLGIIKQHEMKRSSDMQQTSNAIVIMPIETQNVTQEKLEKPYKQGAQKKEMSHQENKLSSLKQKHNNIRTNDTYDRTFVNDFVPERFTNLVSCYFNNAKTIEEFWRCAYFSTIKDTNFDKDTILETAIHSFKQMIRKYKNGRINNPIGYFYGILHKKLDEIFFEQMDEFYSSGEYEPLSSI